MSLTVKIKTLTPLWTGGIDGTMDCIHETGILGSLRWWYEAIVRGLGGSACDPTEHTCSFDAEKYRKSKVTDERQRLRDAGLCDVCQVFGATGWRRRFRLEVVEDRTQPVWTPKDKILNIRPPRRQRGWYLMPGRMGELILSLQGDEQVLSMLACLFLWLEQFGTLGARPQLGYGAFIIVNREEFLAQAQKWQWILGKSKVNTKLPNLRDFLFFRYTFSPTKPGWWTQVPGVGRVGSQVQPLVSRWNTVPTTPALKNEWRFNRWQGSQREEIEIFGTLHPDRRRGRIGATWAYKNGEGQWQIHGWAWMPAQEGMASQLWDILTDNHIWNRVLGVRGDLQFFPTTQGWQSWSVQELQQFLQGACT